MSPIARIAALAACLALSAGAALAQQTVKAGTLEIAHPWSRATPGGAKVAGGYVTVTNSGAAPDTLMAAAADSISGKAEIHEVSMKDGVMSMKRLPAGIAIPAGGTLTLKPGSYHIMFLALKQPLKQGDTFPGSLTFAKAGKVDVEFTVEPTGATAPSMPGVAAPAEPMDHGGMDHMHMDH
jgi:hypothetical protein